MLREYIGESKRTLLFESSNGTPLCDENLRNRVLKPLLARLRIPTAGLHAFRHGRVTVLRKNGTPSDLQEQWIGHSSLRTTDRYSHTSEELEFRRQGRGESGGHFACWTHRTHIGPSAEATVYGVGNAA